MVQQRRDLEDVLRAGFELLDANGLEALTLRAIARHLDAHLNTVSFQVKTKARLLDLMADRVLSNVALADLPSEPAERAVEIAHRYRLALLSRRDGARLVAGTSVFDLNTLTVGEALIGALLDAGATETSAARAFWAIVYLTLGLVMEEQSATDDAAQRLGEVVTDGRFPALARTQGPLTEDSFDERFAFGVRALVTAGLFGGERGGRRPDRIRRYD